MYIIIYDPTYIQQGRKSFKKKSFLFQTYNTGVFMTKLFLLYNYRTVLYKGLFPSTKTIMEILKNKTTYRHRHVPPVM